MNDPFGVMVVAGGIAVVLVVVILAWLGDDNPKH